MKTIIENHVCEWIGDGEKCRHPTLLDKSYCEDHRDRIYLKLLPEMAEYLIDKEVNLEFKRTDYN